MGSDKLSYTYTIPTALFARLTIELMCVRGDTNILEAVLIQEYAVTDLLPIKFGV